MNLDTMTVSYLKNKGKYKNFFAIYLHRGTVSYLKNKGKYKLLNQLK